MDKTVKYTKLLLTKLENIITTCDYTLRYEKGHFKSGYCLLRKQKILIIGKFYTTEGKINTLLDILRTIPIDTNKLDEASKKKYHELCN